MLIKQIAAIRRKPGLTHVEFSAYVRNVHGRLAAAQPLGVLRYVQNHVFDGAYGAPSDAVYTGISTRDLVTELWFADGAAMEQNFADPYARTVLREDGKKFNDFSTATGAIAREAALRVPNAGDGEVKAFYYIKFAQSGVDEAAEATIRAAHAAILETNGDVARDVRECVASFPLGGSNAQHFGGADAPAFDAIVMLRFADEAGLAGFRPYQSRFEQLLPVDASRSFFVFTHEAVIFDVARGYAVVPA